MKIQTINTIELTSICNNKCRYCPAKDQHKYREVGHMNREVFEAAVEKVLYFCRQGTQKELNLFGVGEPTLHPHLVEFIDYARTTLPFKQPLHINTNGKTMTRELALRIKNAGITSIDVTVHDGHYYEAVKAIRIMAELGILFKISVDPVVGPNNWAGQVDWFDPHYSSPCPWIGRGQGVVLSNGDITRCCIDAFAKGIMGNILKDDIAKMNVDAFALCNKCHHTDPVKIIHT